MHYAYNTFVFNDEPLQHKTSQLETPLAVLHQQNKQRSKWQLTRSSTNTEHAHLCTVERNTRDAKPNAFNMCTYTKFIPQIPGRNAVYLTTPRTSLISVPVEWLSLSFRIPGLPGSNPGPRQKCLRTLGLPPQWPWPFCPHKSPFVIHNNANN